MLTLKRVATVGLMIVATQFTALGPASASCVAGSGPDGSPIIFVGVAGPTEGGYTTMTVERVVAGPDQPKTVRVQSGPAEPNVTTSVDAEFTPGDRYLVGTDRSMRTNACTIEALGPDADPGAGPSAAPQETPTNSGDGDGDDVSAKRITIGGAAVLALAGGAFWWARRRSPS